MDREEREALKENLLSRSKSVTTYFEFLLAHEKFPSFAAFMEHYKSRATCSQCQANWSDPQVAIHCKDCANDDNSCFCVKCFVNSNHEGHTAYVRPSAVGTCDCGDPVLWKPEGFCDKHGGVVTTTTEEMPEFHELFEDIVSFIFSGMAEAEDLSGDKSVCVEFLVQWVGQFLQCGDLFRTMVARGIANTTNLDKFLVSMSTATEGASQSVVDLFSPLMNHGTFCVPFAAAFFKAEEGIREKWKEIVLAGAQASITALGILTSIMFHCVSILPLKVNLKKGFDFPAFITNFIKGCIRDSLNVEQYRGEAPMPRYYVELASSVHRYATLGAKFNGAAGVQRIADGLVEGCLEFDDKVSTSPATIVPYIFVSIQAALLLMAETFQEIPLNAISFDLSHAFKVSVPRWREVAKQFQSFTFVEKHDITLIQPSDFFLHDMLSHSQCDKEMLLKLCREYDIPLDSFLLASTGFLMPIHAFKTLLKMHLVSGRNHALSSFCENFNCNFGFTVLRNYYTCMQRLFGMADDKEKIIRMFAELFGMFDESVFDGAGAIKAMRFDFLYTVLSYVSNRTLHNLHDDKDDVPKEKMSWYLIEKSATAGELQAALPDFNDRSSFKRMLFEMAEPVKTKTGKQWKLKGDDHWNPLTPFIDIANILNVLSKWIENHPNKLLPFKRLEPEVCGMNLSAILATNVIRASMYQILSDLAVKADTMCDVSVQLVLGSLLLYSDIDEAEVPAPSSVISADSFADLVEKLPKGAPFRAYLRQKISFKGRDPASIVDLVGGCGTIGADTLVRMKIGVRPEATKSEDENARKREMARKMRMRVLGEMQAKKNLFLEQDGEEPTQESTQDADEEKCVVCSRVLQNEASGYPVLVWESHLPLQFDGESSWKSILMFNLCQHALHTQCAGDDETFTCAMDRFPRNNVLPILPEAGGAEPSEAQKEAMSAFTCRLSLVYDGDDVLERLISSISNVIVLFDVRLRASIDALDKVKHSLLAQHLFRFVWHQCHPGTLPESTEITPFRSYMRKLIASPNPLADSEKIMREAIEEMKDKPQIDLYVLLRRIRLAEHFCLGKSVQSFGTLIDWDELLSPRAFAEIVKFDEEEYKLPVFRLCELPENYLHMVNEPYNVPIELSTKRIYMSLLDRKVYSSGNDGISSYPPLEQLLEAEHGEPVFVMCIGVHGTTCVSVWHRFHLTAELPYIYLDEYGEPDDALERGQIVFLSEERCAKLADLIISGDFVELYKVG